MVLLTIEEMSEILRESFCKYEGRIDLYNAYMDRYTDALYLVSKKIAEKEKEDNGYGPCLRQMRQDN